LSKKILFFILLVWCLHASPNITVSSGNIYKSVIEMFSPTNIWFGVYGNVSSTESHPKNLTSSAGNITTLTLYYPNCRSNKTYILSSLSNTINFDNLSRGNPVVLDIIYLGYSSDLPDSANNTFKQLRDYLFDNYNLTNVSVTYTFTYNSSPYFDLGLLYDNSTGHFVYITTIHQNSKVYNNETADYQMMLPVRNGSSQETYYFFAYVPKACGGCNYELLPGWNLISLCVNPSNKSIESVFSDINGSYSYVRRWNVSSQNFETWSKYASINPFNTLEVNQSYFIYITESHNVNLNLSGDSNHDMNISLVKYWNPPSHPYTFNVSVNELISSINDTYWYIRKWNASSQAFTTYSRFSVYHPFNTVYVGEGVYVYENQNDTLVYDYE